MTGGTTVVTLTVKLWVPGEPMPAFMRWGEAGAGQWVTIYTNPGHAYMLVAGLRFDTSGRALDSSRWHTSMRSASGYTARHPEGL